MKFTTMVQGFSKGITPAVDVSSKGDKKFEGTDRINLEVNRDEIVVSAFNKVVAITSKLSDLTTNDLSYRFDTEGKTSVNAKDLMSVLESFPPESSVIFELKTGKDGKAQELSVTMEKDADQFQTLPCFGQLITLPTKATQFTKTAEIRKDILSYGVGKVAFAAGFEKAESSKIYLNTSLKFNKDKVRFSNGTGARHAVLDLEGTGLVKGVTSEIAMLIPAAVLLDCTKLIETSNSDMVKIEESKKSDIYPFQIIFSSDPHEIIVVGLDSSLQWVKEDNIIKQVYDFKMVTKGDDWAYAAKGTSATFNEQIKKERRAHKAHVDVDMAKKTMTIKTNETMRSNRKVSIVDANAPKESNCSFICMSAYLREISNIVRGDDYIQVEAIGAKKPVLIRFYAGDKVADGDKIKLVNSAKNFTEQFVVFFGTHSA